MAHSIDPNQAQHLLRQAENQMNDALAMVPADRKRAYMKACEKCPELVKQESHALPFLRYCDFNVWAAVERLVQYWEDRHRLFGERAFLPMTQTGDGALDTHDLMALHAGFFVLLPESKTSGKQVLFVDRTKCLKGSSREMRLRCLFYLFQVMSEKEHAQTKGILLFVLLVQPRVVDFDHEFVQQAVALMDNSFLVKVHFHVLNCLPKSGKTDMVQFVIRSAVGYIMKSFQNRCEVYLERSRGELFALMTKLGLQPAGVPVGVGGSWKHEEFTKWCRQRSIQERASARVSPTSLMPPSPSLASKPETKTKDKDSSDVDALLGTTDKTERKRLVNVIHSRQKRERRKAEQKLLEQEATMLEAKKRRLMTEQEQLQGLLVQANDIVARLESEANIFNGAPLPSQQQQQLTQAQHAGNANPNGFRDTASALLQRSAEERNMLMLLLLQNNPEFAANLTNQNPQAALLQQQQQQQQQLLAAQANANQGLQQQFGLPANAPPPASHQHPQQRQLELLVQRQRIQEQQRQAEQAAREDAVRLLLSQVRQGA